MESIKTKVEVWLITRQAAQTDPRYRYHHHCYFVVNVPLSNLQGHTAENIALSWWDYGRN